MIDTADFFRPGRTYIRHAPYRAPEITQEFICVGTGTNPRNDEQRAFGFYREGSTSDWFSTALRREKWAPGQWLSYPTDLDSDST